MEELQGGLKQKLRKRKCLLEDVMLHETLRVRLTSSSLTAQTVCAHCEFTMCHRGGFFATPPHSFANNVYHSICLFFDNYTLGTYFPSHIITTLTSFIA